MLNDLYRLGFIGNFLPESKTYHWQHRGDNALILSDEWRICIHHALYSALSIGGRVDYGLKKNSTPQRGDVARAVIISVKETLAIAKFLYAGKEYYGFIPISNFKKVYDVYYISDLTEYAKEGDEHRVIIGEYNQAHNTWGLKISDILDEQI